jgi:CubicO group peptidase (beta-lactamase class C family)
VAASRRGHRDREERSRRVPQRLRNKGVGRHEPVTGDTLFQIASTSKAFTSTALAMLAAENKLSWDDPVRKHLDYFHLADMCADSQVTIRDIVSHRTGLSRHDELWDNSPLTREDVVRRIGTSSSRSRSAAPISTRTSCSSPPARWSARPPACRGTSS